MAQTLLIGLGGTGSRVVNNVVKILQGNGETINNGDMFCAVLDTNANDNKHISNSGTGVPVIPTSKPQKIRDYFEQYSNLHMETWCPQSPPFLEESMIDGASEIRVKSRIAFMDCVNSDEFKELERMINEVLKSNSGSKIRIMIVSSLSGGTGSGMFIQVALWLRKFLSQSQITIRGIFLLPDVFVSTISDIRQNKTTKVRHYCNAYAAIRELNAITKIKQSGSAELSERLQLGDLFDSIKDRDTGKPVYDFAFFVDSVDENGITLDSIDDYEKMVAQLVYMQMHAPMKDDMYSEEDNAFLSFEENDEPLYGSCGTSKAVYPTKSVKTYCAIRATQDSLADGWKKLDSEMDALLKERQNEEKEGIYRSESFDKRSEYIRLFDKKTAVKADEAGKDRFFLSIAKDVKNEKNVKGENDKTTVKYTNKVDDFIHLLKTKKIDTLITEKCGTEDYELNEETFVSTDHTKEDLIAKAKADDIGLEEVLDAFDKKVNEYANDIVDEVFPYSMGEVNANNNCTVYGLLTKEDDLGNNVFVHPVAARYILYKLVAQMEQAIGGIALEASREDALEGGDVAKHFDNAATSETETTPEEFLNSKRWNQRKEAFLNDFEKRYVQYIDSKIELCKKYEKECLMVGVYQGLIERVNGLIKQMELFFTNLDYVQKKLDNDLAANITETQGVVGKTVYVYGDAKSKERIYNSLDFALDKSDSKINKSVIDSVYGCFCAERRPDNTANSKYVNIDLATAFLLDTINGMIYKINHDANNSKNVNMDIYTALCKESDAEFEAKDGSVTKFHALDNLDLETGSIRVDNAAIQRHKDAFVDCKNTLFRMAAPFLVHDKEVSTNEMGTRTMREKTFWGFSPAVVDSCPYVGAELGINADLQADTKYAKNELYCYRAVYGMEATYIPKFNELNEGAYYTCYKTVVNNMVKDSAGRQGERAYVRTPHLDKTWHKILPYITEAKRRESELEFFHGFWLAIAYGVLKTDKDGYVYIKRSINGGYDNYIDDVIAITDGDKHLTKTDVVRLVEALRADEMFSASDIPELERRYADELDKMTTYVGTDVLKGLTVKKEDLNPVNLVSRYHEALNNDKRVTALLVSALEKIAVELAERYNVRRSEEHLEEAKYKICKKIYDSSTRIKGKSEVFGRWEQAFEKFKIKGDSAENTSSNS